MVIVDEAHNLVDAVNAVHSAVITRKQLATAESALDAYHGRFSGRLAPGILCTCGFPGKDGQPNCLQGCAQVTTPQAAYEDSSEAGPLKDLHEY